ncbi:hypothetical protein [Kribbella sp. NBC_00889]|uniref:hypothetical protein n=1 Tax=Kribbella sp. NBC_00889 TaxID=2975974 RepID=UPI00386B902A|nr:hypothetical protein OG817_30575 [Kribbella sp. NBC_00889]
MEWLAVLFLFLFLCALLDAVLPHSKPSHLRRWLQPSIDRLIRRRRRRAGVEADPFATLWVQTRLGHLAGEIRRIETTPRIYARAHRLMAVEAAYDDLLDEACRLAGVPGEADLERSEEKRWLEERELASRGWSW